MHSPEHEAYPPETADDRDLKAGVEDALDGQPSHQAGRAEAARKRLDEFERRHSPSAEDDE